ncbi:metallophosphoesterase family protein [Aquabacterium humicola]|uniref:metallophosphoesterase family protein n=1 Tax=Aquabacterium humicola TaxID=3237377 RepID=UPI0025439E5C|nr:metallophosphoesterase family protein [Rubrivivax pictus]
MPLTKPATGRIAVLSDIHGNLPALEAVLAEAGRAGAATVVNLGDIVSGPLWPAETAARLMALDWPTIAGNHERQVLTQPPDRMGLSDAQTAPLLDEAQRAWLQSLPPTRWLDDEVFCCHGTPGTDLVYLMETLTGDFDPAGSPGLRAATPAELAARLGTPGARLVLCGHSHVARTMQLGDTLVVNPGSVGLQAFEDDHVHRHRVEAGSPHARWVLAELRAGQWHVEHRLTPYDWEAAAVQAESKGRPDWADALRTGFVGRTLRKETTT